MSISIGAWYAAAAKVEEAVDEPFNIMLANKRVAVETRKAFGRADRSVDETERHVWRGVVRSTERRRSLGVDAEPQTSG